MRLALFLVETRPVQLERSLLTDPSCFPDAMHTWPTRKACTCPVGSCLRVSEAQRECTPCGSRYTKLAAFGSHQVSRLKIIMLESEQVHFGRNLKQLGTIWCKRACTQSIAAPLTIAMLARKLTVHPRSRHQLAKCLQPTILTTHVVDSWPNMMRCSQVLPAHLQFKPFFRFWLPISLMQRHASHPRAHVSLRRSCHRPEWQPCRSARISHLASLPANPVLNC